jgi:hypothetical protein
VYITKLKGPARWTYFYLYVIIDIFSRRVVGWSVADAESTILFKALSSVRQQPCISFLPEDAAGRRRRLIIGQFRDEC